MTILGISEKQRIKLDVSVNFLKKKPLFLHFKTTTFFLFHFTVLKECNTFESNSESFSPSWSLQPTNSCFTPLKAISDRDLQTMLHSSINYWFYYCDFHKLRRCQRPAEKCTKNLGDTFHCRHIYIR